VHQWKGTANAIQTLQGFFLEICRKFMLFPMNSYIICDPLQQNQEQGIKNQIKFLKSPEMVLGTSIKHVKS
jgi:hypothetical protein